MTTPPSPRDPRLCCSGASFGRYCVPILTGEAAPSVLALMRSRHSAHVLGDGNHLLCFWHPKTRPALSFHDPKTEWFSLQTVNVDRSDEEDSGEIVESITPWRSPAESADSSQASQDFRALQSAAGAVFSASGAAFPFAEPDSSASTKGSSLSDAQSQSDGVLASFVMESMRECSRFLRCAGRWVYLGGDI